MLLPDNIFFMSDNIEREAYKWRRFSRKKPVDIIKPGPGQESIWDYPRPPKVEFFAKRIRVVFAGETIADSKRNYKVMETASPPCYYIPQTDINMNYLIRSNHTSLCEWKGSATYWSVKVGDNISENAGWSYTLPWDGFELIRDCIAFYAGRVDACFIDGEKVKPQAGNFYGGWITSNIVGPFKGERGTEYW